MKKGLIIFLIGCVGLTVVLFNLPIEITHSSEIDRGNELIASIEREINESGKIPNSNDWNTLESIGFTSEEMERAYPEIRSLNDSTFELIFTLGFDPPYLMWNSNEQIWKEGFPSIPEEWKK